MDQISSGLLCYPEDDGHNTQDLFFYAIHNEVTNDWWRIPQSLHGERIRGCFHGCVIFSNHPNNNKWSLWNQVASTIISLPTLILKDGEYTSIGDCCLSAPPDHPGSVLLLTRTNKSSFVFFRINSRRNKFRWTEMSYAQQLKRLTNNGKLVHSLTCCDGKVYALNSDATYSRFVIYVDIVVKEKEVVIKLKLFSGCPYPSGYGYCRNSIVHLKGSSTELFYIRIYVEEGTTKAHKIPIAVHIFKSDMTCIDWEVWEYLQYWDMSDVTDDKVTDSAYRDLQMSMGAWEEINDLKDTIFFVDLARDHLVSYGRVIASEFAGFIHIRGNIDETIYSYHVKNETITPTPIPSPMLPTSHLPLWDCMSLWECRLKDDCGEASCIVDSKVERENNSEVLLRSGTDDGFKYNESLLLDVPSKILEIIIEFCVGVEYMNFRATCKQCYLAAPFVNWCNDTSFKRLQTYSVASPWLMVVYRKGFGMTFTDPMLGDNYFMRKPLISIVHQTLYCSRFGWLLFESVEMECLIFFNPFINDIWELPELDYDIISMCFSAPPTSLDCMVVGFSALEGWRVHILFVNQEQTWRTIDLGPDPHAICFSTFYGRDLYALCKGGELIVVSNLGKEDCSWKLVEAKAPKGFSTQYFLTNCNEHLLLVSVGGEYGGPVEVFKCNESKQEWEKMDSVGKHMIYICGVTCLCIEAKVPKMENKIFFPRLHTKNRKVVFYSLDTFKYHTFDGENLQEDVGALSGITYSLSENAWIEPSWS